jgi:hypothetical protein
MSLQRRRPDEDAQSELFPELIDLLIHGWENLPPWNADDDEARAERDVLRLWEFSEAELASIAERHRTFLVAEARRRGVGSVAYLNERNL